MVVVSLFVAKLMSFINLLRSGCSLSVCCQFWRSELLRRVLALAVKNYFSNLFAEGAPEEYHRCIYNVVGLSDLSESG